MGLKLLALPLVLLTAVTTWASPVFTLSIPATAAARGGEAHVDLVALNPLDAEVAFTPPAELAATLRINMRAWPVTLRAANAIPAQLLPSSFGVQAYTFTLPADATGEAILETRGLGETPLRAVIEITAASASVIVPADNALAAESLSSLVPARPAATALLRTFAGRLGVHEPIYFIYGPDDPAAKFQFSFKYRLFNLGKATPTHIPATLQFAYTQRSIWDIQADSSPFYDTSYMPEIMFESLAPVSPEPGLFSWLGYQAAFKHESNGREGLTSRSLNTVYLRTVFALGKLEGWHLLVIPEAFTYVSSLSNNPLLKDYRGYGQLRLIFGENEGPSLMTTLWAGKDFDNTSVQLDLAIPVRTQWLNFETYLLFQYFDGYGESLRSYTEKSSTIRAGFSFVR